MKAHAITDRRRSATSRISPGTGNKRRRIVIVEDDTDIRVICSEVLRDRGFIVVECGTLFAARLAVTPDAGEGMEIPDLILLDRDLPDGSGLDFARWVRCRSDCSDVRIVAFSGRSAPAEIEEAFAAGCDAFVAKPCTASVLTGEIQRALAGAPTEPPAQSEVRRMGSAERSGAPRAERPRPRVRGRR